MSGNLITEAISDARLQDLIHHFDGQAFRGDVTLALQELQRRRITETACGDDAARYRYLRDKAGNKIMQALMDTAIPPEWDRLVDADMESDNG